MRNASDDLTSDSVCGHFNSLDLKCFKSGYKKSPIYTRTTWIIQRFFVRRELAWRFILTNCDIYQNPFTQEKILKFWQCRTKKLLSKLRGAKIFFVDMQLVSKISFFYSVDFFLVKKSITLLTYCISDY
jgi:hypothetical protein